MDNFYMFMIIVKIGKFALNEIWSTLRIYYVSSIHIMQMANIRCIRVNVVFYFVYYSFLWGLWTIYYLAIDIRLIYQFQGSDFWSLFGSFSAKWKEQNSVLYTILYYLKWHVVVSSKCSLSSLHFRHPAEKFCCQF